MANEPKTEAIPPVDLGKAEQLLRLLRNRIWPSIPKELRGRHPISKEEKEAILGYGPEGL